MKKKSVYLFDLDGVLIDSKKNMELSWRAVAKKYSLNINFKNYFLHIGLPFFKILSKLKIKKHLYKKISNDYKFNSIKNINHIKLHKGVKKNFFFIKKKKKIIGILTSKEKSRTIKILKKFNIKTNILMCPKNNMRGKPDPKQINELVKKKNISKNKVVFIGDMAVDKLTAKNAKIDYIHAKYGYSKKIKNKYILKKIDDIIDYNLGIS